MIVKDSRPGSNLAASPRDPVGFLTPIAAHGTGSMMVHAHRKRSALVLTAALLFSPALAPGDSGGRLPPPPPSLAGLDPAAAELSGGKYVQRLADGRALELTLEPALQQAMLRLFRDNEVPAGVAVAIDTRTGRVLALAEQGGHGLWGQASAPAASVFKLVTASALVEKAGVSPDQEVCYGGGSHRLVALDLEDDTERDAQCASLSQAVGFSINAVVAKLADRHLDRASLLVAAEAFGWNQDIPFDLPVDTSAADLPTERLEVARTAAGFWHTTMSPLHAALLAQALAQNGQMLRPWLVSRVTSAAGQVLYEGSPRFWRTAVAPATARALARMMTVTTESGTSRRAFHDREGRPYLRNVRVAGKTGTLNGYEPTFRAYTWFVGFAPVEAPRVAVATLVVNNPTWRIKASEVARELLQAYFRAHPRG